MLNDKIFDGVLLVSDFDATLTDSRGMLLPEVTDAIRSFIDRGGLFSVSTGRTKQGFIAWRDVPFNAPVMLGNGVMSYDYERKRVVFADSIDESIKPFLYALTERFPDISIELYGVDFTSFCYHPDAVSVDHFGYQLIEWKEIDSFEEVSFPLVKIMLSVGNKGAAVERMITENLPGCAKYIWDRGGFIEIISAEAGKASGLRKLAASLGVGESHVYAIGDGVNDVDMLLAAHLSFAPCNAQPAAKQAADIIVRDNNHASVAHAIEILESFYS